MLLNKITVCQCTWGNLIQIQVFLFVFILGRLTIVLAHQADVQLGSSVTLPCIDSNYTDIEADLLDIQWWTGEHLVTRFQLGRIIQGNRFIHRTDLSTEAIRKGDFSLLITHTEYNDSGRYRCVLIKDGQRVTLGEVDLVVKGNFEEFWENEHVLHLVFSSNLSLSFFSL